MPLGGFAPLPIRLGADFDAASHARVCADLASMSRTAPLCRFTYQPSNPVVFYDYVGMNGVGLAWVPTAVWNGTGDVTFYIRSFTDAYGVEYRTSLRYGRATAHWDAVLISKAQIVEIRRNHIRVLTREMSSGVGQNVKTTLTVY